MNLDTNVVPTDDGLAVLVIFELPDGMVDFRLTNEQFWRLMMQMNQAGRAIVAAPMALKSGRVN